MILKSSGLQKLALVLILGGALGNVFDRILYKSVPDFIDFHIGDFHWFIFNIADIFITIGVIFIIATILSIYHVGIEQEIIKESPICKSSSGINILDKEELLKELKKNTISCKNPTFFIFGLSLATINTFVSMIFSFITLREFYNYEKK